MKKLLNIVYVSQPDIYLALKGHNLNLVRENKTIGRIPLHNIEGICTFGYQGVSPALMHWCVENNISISFFSNSGRLRGRVTGITSGNVYLRKEQYRISECENQSLLIAKNMILGKLYNSENLL